MNREEIEAYVDAQKLAQALKFKEFCAAADSLTNEELTRAMDACDCNPVIRPGRNIVHRHGCASGQAVLDAARAKRGGCAQSQTTEDKQ